MVARYIHRRLYAFSSAERLLKNLVETFFVHLAPPYRNQVVNYELTHLGLTLFVCSFNVIHFPRRLFVRRAARHSRARSTVCVAKLSVLLRQHLSLGDLPEHPLEGCDGHHQGENGPRHSERDPGQYGQ